MKKMSIPWRVVLVLSTVLALGGLGAAGWYGYTWYTAAQGTSAESTEARDGALRASRQLADTLQTINPYKPEQSLDAWEAAATGNLLDQLKRDRGKFLEQLKKAPSSASASVLDTALTELDAAAGTATAIAAVDVTQSKSDNNKAGAPTTRQLRLKLTLKLTDAGWKASSAGIVQA